MSTCKYIFGIQQIVKEYFNILPSSLGLHAVEHDNNVEPLSFIKMNAPNVDMSMECGENNDPRRGLLDALV